MTIKDIETRSAEIREAMTAEDADLKALIAEAKELKTRKAEIIEAEKAEAKAKEIEAEVRKAEINAVIAGDGIEVEKKEKIEMTTEVRDSKEYMDAYAKYVIGEGKEEEVRSLLTVDADPAGTVPVPTILDGRIRAAWEKDGIVSRISKSYVKGNLSIGYEVSATGAEWHEEGGEPVREEEVVLGTIDIIPQFIKKYITVSDRAIDIGMGGQYVLDYLYDEFENKITKVLADTIIEKIGKAGAPFVSTVATNPSLTAVAAALATLSDEAANPVIIMNKASEIAFIEAYADSNFGFDPFRGLTVLYNNTLPVYSADLAADTPYAIVGDLGGVKGNFPNGEEIKFIFDEYTYAESDMIKITGKLMAGVGVVQPGAFALLTSVEG